MIKAVRNKKHNKVGRPQDPNAKWLKVYKLIEADNALAQLGGDSLAAIASERLGIKISRDTAYVAKNTWKENHSDIAY